MGWGRRLGAETNCGTSTHFGSVQSLVQSSDPGWWFDHLADGLDRLAEEVEPLVTQSLQHIRRPGGSEAIEAAWVAIHRPDLAMCLDTGKGQAALACLSLLDHLKAMAAVIRSRLLAAPLTIARAAIEAAGRLLYVVGPEVSSIEDRCARIYASRVRAASDEWKALRTEESRERLRRLQTEREILGLKELSNDEQPTLGHLINLAVGVEDRASGDGKGPDLARVVKLWLSGVSHSEPGSLLALSRSRDSPVHHVTESSMAFEPEIAPSTVASVAATTTLAASRALLALDAHRGSGHSNNISEAFQRCFAQTLKPMLPD